jgi:hypothetical protein
MASAQGVHEARHYVTPRAARRVTRPTGDRQTELRSGFRKQPPRSVPGLATSATGPSLVGQSASEVHLALGITDAQRFRFASLMSLAADDAGMPSDPEFRSALVAYLEWGTRLALGNSQPGAEVITHAPVPRWGWGEAPPYLP